ncbi:MAG TPA: hypothetical protein VE224_12870, partial [Pseudolabrys sp.]|nr:hypothetical protein [Pseudolabrys sp.]
MTSRLTSRHATAFARSILILIAVAGAAPALAQQAPRAKVARGGGALPPPSSTTTKKGVWSFSIGSDLVSQYISRGLAFADTPSVQPYASIGLSLPQLTGDTVKSVKLSVGNWDSLQFGAPGLGQADYGPWSGWYESDLYTALNIGLTNGLSASFTVYYYHSPEHSFADYGDFE